MFRRTLDSQALSEHRARSRTDALQMRRPVAQWPGALRCAEKVRARQLQAHENSHDDGETFEHKEDGQARISAWRRERARARARCANGEQSAGSTLTLTTSSAAQTTVTHRSGKRVQIIDPRMMPMRSAAPISSNGRHTTVGSTPLFAMPTSPPFGYSSIGKKLACTSEGAA